MKYCLKKIHQYILAIFSRIIELINFIIYIIKNFNKIKFKLEKINDALNLFRSGEAGRIIAKM